MADPTRFHRDPAARHADERIMTPPGGHPAEDDTHGVYGARRGAEWRAPEDDFFGEPGGAETLEEELAAFDLDERGGHERPRRPGGGAPFAAIGRHPAIAGGTLAGAALAGAGVALLLAGPGQTGARPGVEERARLRRRLARLRAKVDEGTEGMGAEARARIAGARMRAIVARERALDRADRDRARALAAARGGMTEVGEHPALAGTVAAALAAALAGVVIAGRERV